MGGSGKTTIAKAIYGRIYRPFIGKSFVENIKELWVPKYRIVHGNLQRDLLYVSLNSIFRGGKRWDEKNYDREWTCLRKLLIVLDDVNDFSQIQNLCGSHERFGQGTVIIIITRDVNVLNRFKVNYVYKMDGMNENDSLELLSCHAFAAPKPKKTN